eukprot:TRINITY_DN934_c6_g2_i1.p1 TRINITY_DN934_c6_g2~~TRINITY_DN934_c6_g2_i1.p1  ORF type:complete len:368 (+),score=73.20 TRINITY_DN934_c6_g2_i1:113-1216(+)
MQVHNDDVIAACVVVAALLLLWRRIAKDFSKGRLVVQDWEHGVVYLVSITTPPGFRKAGQLPFCPDGRCLAAETVLRLARVRYEKLPSYRARAQAPCHELPLIELNGKQFVGFVDGVRAVGGGLCSSSDPAAQAAGSRVQAALQNPESWVMHKLLHKELHFSIERNRWAVPRNFDTVKATFFHWVAPLIRSYGALVARMRALGRCWAHGSLRQSEAAHHADVHTTLHAIELYVKRTTDCLEQWIDGLAPGPSDASTYAYLKQVVDDPVPEPLVPDITRYPNCCEYVRRMEQYLESLDETRGELMLVPSADAARCPKMQSDGSPIALREPSVSRDVRRYSPHPRFARGSLLSSGCRGVSLSPSQHSHK